MNNIALLLESNLDEKNSKIAFDFAEIYDLPIISSTDDTARVLILCFSTHGISILKKEHKKILHLNVDFTSGAVDHRRRFGGGKGQAIARAIGIRSKFLPTVLDATAGLGRDAFVLASLGAVVTMLERSPVVKLLLADGISRACHSANKNKDTQLQDILGRMTLLQDDSRSFLQASEQQFDVVYLDPMFPDRKKSAKVKKDMQIFHEIVGADEDSNQLLHLARKKARYRVVVKRPRHAPDLANEKPHHVLVGKSSRFDIYTLKAIP